MELKKLKRAADNKPITIMIDKDVHELYSMGKMNGWDVSDIVRQAAADAIRNVRERLMQKAEHA